LVNTTVSADEQVPLVTVQRSEALVPAGTPVIVDEGEEGVVIVAVPLITLHRPEPVVGELPASVKVPLLHCS
jgi:hypothetical protein